MRTPTTRRILSAAAMPAALAAVALAPAARADTVIAAAPGAKNLAAGAGWRAWAAPAAGGRWKLVTRAPTGTIAAAKIKSFAVPPDPFIGSTALVAPKRLVAVYSRCKGASATSGCDVYQYDLVAGTERKVTRISTASASETSPSLAFGSYGFVRRGGPHPGVYTATRTHIRRIDSRVASETAVSQSRITFRVGGTVMLSQLDGANKRTIRKGAADVFSIVITRYRVGWLVKAGAGTAAFMTNRINPSGSIVIRRGSHDLPASTQSAVADSSRIVEYLDAAGVKRAVPPLFR